MKQFFEIRKVDEEQRMVWGYASTEMVDSQGETVTKAAMEAAWDDYMKFGNIREMHQPSAVGVVKEYSFDDMGVMIGAYIVDDAAWKKVVEKVYKGFSIGGKKLKDGYDAITKTITALKLTEISLVDRPANPEALITVWKADQLEDNEMDKKNEAHVDALAELLNKGAISPERLVELANADIAKSAEPVAPATPAIEQPAAPALSPAAQLEAMVKAEAAASGAASGDAPAAAPVVSDNIVKTETVPYDANGNTKVQPDATPQKTNLQKSIALLGSKGEDIQKGLYQVSSFADLINSLGWLQESVAYEAAYEGDGSDLPSKIAAAVGVLGGLLQEMVTEEVAELVASMKLPDGTGGVQMVSQVIANCDMGKDLLKVNEAIDVIKAGARNSAADTDRIQKAHDLLSELGATCGQDDTASKLHKAAEGGTIAKALADFEKVSGELGSLRKSFDALQADHADLKKKWEAAPSPNDTATLVIGKADELGTLATETEPEPVRKTDGSVDDLATAIKKIHAGGGRQIFRA